jgi:hypothetical protein
MSRKSRDRFLVATRILQHSEMAPELQLPAYMVAHISHGTIGAISAVVGLFAVIMLAKVKNEGLTL